MPGSHSRRETNVQPLVSVVVDAEPLTLPDWLPPLPPPPPHAVEETFDAADDIEAILCLRSGKVSITRSRNSNSAPTSCCNSCNDFVCSLWI